MATRGAAGAQAERHLQRANFRSGLDTWKLPKIRGAYGEYGNPRLPPRAIVWWWARGANGGMEAAGASVLWCLLGGGGCLEDVGGGVGSGFEDGGGDFAEELGDQA